MQIGHLKRLSISALIALTAASLSSTNFADGNRVPKICSHPTHPKANNSGVAAARRDKNRRKATRRKARK